MKKNLFVVFFFILCHSFLFGQDYINITFRHYPINQNAVRAYVPGTFNNWGSNFNGRIAIDDSSKMTYIDTLGFYVKTVRLKVGDTHNYKFYEHLNSDGSSYNWYTDPLNPLINYSDYNNSILVVKRAMIFEIAPKNDAVVAQAAPIITAGVFVAEGDSILFDQSEIWLDNTYLNSFSEHVIPNLSILNYKLPELKNGSHEVRLVLKSKRGESATESITFIVVAGDVFFYTPSTDSVWAN